MSTAFKLLGEEEVKAQQPAKPAAEMQQATGLLMLALRSLGKRAFVAILDTFSLFTAFSVWWLFMTMTVPSQNQLISLGMYAVFILLLNVIVRRSKP